MKYTVHIYAIVRVEVPEIEAETQQQALTRAQKQVDLYDLFRRCDVPNGVECIEYADEISHFLVDEEGDEEHEKSKWYDSTEDLMETPFPGIK